MNDLSKFEGQITYLGGSSFQIEYQGQTLMIDPDLRWLHTGKVLNKKDPLTFTIMDSLKHKVSSSTKNLSAYTNRVDFILISSPNYDYFDQMRLILEKNQEILVLAPSILVPKIKNLMKKNKINKADVLSIDLGETIRFMDFIIQATSTEKDRSMIKILNDNDKNNQSYLIQCGNLQLFFASKGSGLPIENLAINTALLPFSFSRYNDTNHLKKFIERFQPDLIIPYMYDHKSVQDVQRTQNGANPPQIHFPYLGEAIIWNS